MRRLLAVLAVSTVALAACSSTSGGGGEPTAASAPPTVVIVSGLLAISPYTTPTEACATGYAAGNTDTFMREQLLAAGFDVYTAPAMIGGGQVVDQDTPAGGPFGDCPPQLPAELTADPSIDPLKVGKSIAAFLRYLQTDEGVDEVHLVGHSMGGPFSRVAMAELKASGDGPRVVSLTTVGSPWEPIMIGNFPPTEDPSVACDGNQACLIFQGAALDVPTVVQQMLPFVQAAGFEPWTQQQVGVLDGVPVTLIGGTYFTKEGGSPERWPNDAVVQIDAALAKSVSDEVLPHRTCHSFPDTHSLSVSAIVGEPDQTALTWDPRVTEAIIAGINAAPTALESENRVGCPAP